MSSILNIKSLSHANVFTVHYFSAKKKKRKEICQTKNQTIFEVSFFSE